MFKYPSYYYVPWEYVCDGQWDCPGGIDEAFCKDTDRFHEMFKCKGTHQICIHVGFVCDDYKNCPLGNDELLCDLKHVQCPASCQCLTLVLSCVNINLNLIQISYPFISVSINYSPRLTYGNVFKNFRKVFNFPCYGE